MKRSCNTLTVILLLAFAVVLAVPFLLRSKAETKPADSLNLVIVSPHNEAIQYEFGRAFSKWHKERFGKPVYVDWRDIGGTSEIARYLSSQYAAVFKAHWIELGREWNATVSSSFSNRKINLEDDSIPAEARDARRTFLESNVSIGIDLFFGGGEYDHSKQASMGQTVPSGYCDTQEGKETLGKNIPMTIAGERWYDAEDRWYGATVSSFGICYNADVLSFIPNATTPTEWRDLGQPCLFGYVALADPTKSGSITKAFEMVIQQEMAEAVRDVSPDSPEYDAALAQGWASGLNVIRLAAANARYFTDSASKVPLDVALGNAAAGMCIDFYGKFQAQEVERKDGTSRMKYVAPMGGTTVSCDPIAMLRGSPDPELALRFITFTLSPEGQKLWGYKVGTPGGPLKYALHRLPIRRDFYTAENLKYASQPDENPYTLAETFTYHGRWTGPYFGLLRLLIRTMCMDTSEELKAAWQTIIENQDACPEAMKVFESLPETAQYGHLAETISSMRRKTDEVVQARLWWEYFAGQYKSAREMLEEN